ncbi:hypothetical protein LIZ98_02665 [Caldibacillus sp. 210928-DFI.2.18]|nr:MULTISPECIES: hypothetical protein [unclassified Caldibacillus]MCB7072316.1 hypothetical protein [Caldibacillus sp. 210928-DFI.2.18]
MVTRTALVVKFGRFSRLKTATRYDWTVSSPKFANSHLKITIKKVGFH